MAKEGIELADEMLKKGETSGKAIETAIKAVEDFPYYKSVGYGGLPNEEQIVELDAGHHKASAPGPSPSSAYGKKPSPCP